MYLALTKGIGVFSIYYTGQEFDKHNDQHIKNIFLGAYGNPGASGPESKSGGNFEGRR